LSHRVVAIDCSSAHHGRTAGVSTGKPRARSIR
jgi:hypothetical protein